MNRSAFPLPSFLSTISNPPVEVIEEEDTISQPSPTSSSSKPYGTSACASCFMIVPISSRIEINSIPSPFVNIGMYVSPSIGIRSHIVPTLPRAVPLTSPSFVPYTATGIP